MNTRKYWGASGACIALLLGGFFTGRYVAPVPQNPRSIKLTLDGAGKLTSFGEGRLLDGKWIRNGFSISAPQADVTSRPFPFEGFIGVALFSKDIMSSWRGEKVLFTSAEPRVVLINSNGELEDDAKHVAPSHFINRPPETSASR